MKLTKNEYFSDDCIIEDSLYIAVKDLLICPLCNKIFKEPYICNECLNAYCKKCLENFSIFKNVLKIIKKLNSVFLMIEMNY